VHLYPSCNGLGVWGGGTSRGLQFVPVEIRFDDKVSYLRRIVRTDESTENPKNREGGKTPENAENIWRRVHRGESPDSVRSNRECYMFSKPRKHLELGEGLSNPIA
jgi:hypothetical protein